MSFVTVPDAAHLQAAAIRDQAETSYTRLREDGRLSPDAIRAGMAVAYLNALDQMQALQQRVTGDAETRARQATTAAWGIDDLAGNDPATRAAVSMTYRDAQERVAQIPFDQPRDALQLLERADDSGDETLARAIAQYAWRNGGLGEWADVLSRYASTRPKAAAALAELLNVTPTSPTANDLFAFVLTKPAELQDIDDWRLQALAESDLNRQ